MKRELPVSNRPIGRTPGATLFNRPAGWEKEDRDFAEAVPAPAGAVTAPAPPAVTEVYAGPRPTGQSNEGPSGPVETGGEVRGGDSGPAPSRTSMGRPARPRLRPSRC